VFIAKKQFAQTEQALQRAIAVDSGSYTAHYLLGQLYRKIGKADAGEREMKIAAQIQQLQGQNPTHPR